MRGRLPAPAKRAREDSRIPRENENGKMRYFVSHDRSEETPEAKARWFQSLTLAERMDYLCEITEMALTLNPRIAEQRNATACSGRIQILSIPRR